MLQGLMILIGCNLAGVAIVEWAGLTIPPAVIGMLLLFIGLLIKGNVPETLAKAGGGLLDNLGLLFVPAGAGISLYLALIAQEWDVILIASVSSTVLTLISCGLLFQILNKGEDHDGK